MSSNVSMGLLWIVITVAIIVTICYTIAKASNKVNIRLILGCGAWLALQGFLAKTGFYTNYNLPPRLVLTGVLPALLCIFYFLFTKRAQPVIRALSLVLLTLVHTIRIPVEYGLHELYLQGLVAKQMTYAGWNYDIFSGLSAPIIALLFYKNMISRKIVLIWNIICLALVLNIVTIAILATPYPFQQLSFEQPNVAVFYFPVIYLPTIIVPIVLFSHIASIKQLLLKKEPF